MFAKRYAKTNATDKSERLYELGIYRAVCFFGALGVGVIGVFGGLLIGRTDLPPVTHRSGLWRSWQCSSSVW